MQRILRDHRRGALAVLAAALLGTATAALIVVQRPAGAHPSARSSPGVARTPSPIPCPARTVASLCAAYGGPAPAPPPAAAASPVQSAAGHPAPGAQPTSHGAAVAATTPGSSTPPTRPDAQAGTAAASLVTTLEAASRFRNAPYLDGLLEILTHPVGAQLPDLHHFRPPPEPAHTPAPRTPAPVRLVAAIVTAIAATVVAGLLAWKRRHPWLLLLLAGQAAIRLAAPVTQLRLPRLRRRFSRTASARTAALPMLLMVGTLALTGTAFHAWRGSPSASRSLATPTHRPATTSAQPLFAQAAASAWTRLLTIERGLAAQQDELVKQEHEIARIAALIAASPTASASPGADTELTNRLAALVAAHQATQGAYQLSLEAEYDLFYSAAESPQSRDQLVTAAAPEARDAVSYNLSLVETQVSQEDAIAAAQAKLAQIGSLTAPPAEPVQHRHPFLAPEVASVSQPFGPTDFELEPPLTYRGVFYPHFHTGIDLAAPLGTPVRAAADGVVILAASSVDAKGHLVGYGNYVVIAHQNGFVTLYGHLDSYAVHAGDAVRQGQLIGREGSTGWSTGPHLHFEVRHGGSLLDPGPYLAGQLPG